MIKILDILQRVTGNHLSKRVIMKVCFSKDWIGKTQEERHGRLLRG